jgi:hypothetical protein
MTNYSDDSDGGPFPKVERKIREAESEQRDLIASGWKWQGDGLDKVLIHPDDADYQIWFDPYTGEQYLSPKLVESIKERLQRDRAQKPDSSDDHS